MERVTLEVRWIILGTDGRHVTLGRHTDPLPEDIAQAEASLNAQGLAGWLVVMKGGYYLPQEPFLMMIRPLCQPQRANIIRSAMKCCQLSKTWLQCFDGFEKDGKRYLLATNIEIQRVADAVGVGLLYHAPSIPPSARGYKPLSLQHAQRLAH